MSKSKIMYILKHYPQISETYIQTEIDAVSEDFEVIVITLSEAGKGSGTSSYKQHNPFLVINDIQQLYNAIQMFKPQVLHTHWSISLPLIYSLAKKFGIPFTLRAHSFDTIETDGQGMKEWWKSADRVITDSVNDELCLGVLAFPFSRPFLEAKGALPHKIIDSFPCIDFRRFYDRSPNGDAIMNTGACTRKKKMEDFLELGASMTNRVFNLYPVSYKVKDIVQKNQDMGSPINIYKPVEPCMMPREYKKHQWMVYTADSVMKNVGWPLAIAEAQASGVGVLLPDIRPDMRDYIGESGYLYKTLEEAREIISKPVPEHIREAGFENARKSDVYSHKVLLTDLWVESIRRC